jgi:hypothetical protein
MDEFSENLAVREGSMFARTIHHIAQSILAMLPINFLVWRTLESPVVAFSAAMMEVPEAVLVLLDNLRFEGEVIIGE